MVILTSFPPPAEGVRHRQENTSAHVQDRNLGSGTLFIAESRVSWVGGDGQGFSLEYPAISLHAVSKDLSAFPHACLYMMVDGDLGHSAVQNGDTESSDEGDDDDDIKISEIRFVPTDTTALDLMYKVMSECQILHPDPEDQPSDEEGEEGYFEDEEGAENLTAEGQATLSRLEAMMDPGDDGIDTEEPQSASQPGDDGAGAAGEPMDAQFDDADQ